MKTKKPIPTGISAYKAADGSTKSSYRTSGDLVSGEIKHTATPWVLKRHGVIVGGPFHEYTNGSAQDQIAMTCVVQEGCGDQYANAEFIVRACNAHDDLVKALQHVLEDDGYLPRATSKCRDVVREALAKAGA